MQIFNRAVSLDAERNSGKLAVQFPEHLIQEWRITVFFALNPG